VVFALRHQQQDKWYISFLLGVASTAFVKLACLHVP